ncbi:MAG: hypothetical protein FJ144_19850 [Deltaproteobacteria bacterium]|nr:hypothetical protein [Deltaproteobacteria bacterium]
MPLRMRQGAVAGALPIVRESAMTDGMRQVVLASRQARLAALALVVVASFGCSRSPEDAKPEPSVTAGAADPSAAEGEARASSATRPNIVLIIGDDLGYPFHGFMGDRLVQTPHLDRLASEGTVFVNAYVTASKCAPSLRTLLTGDLPFRPKPKKPRPRVPWKQETLPTLLGKQGYASYQAGKFWEPGATDAGFTDGTKSGELGGSIPEQWMGGAKGLAIGRRGIQPVREFIDRHAAEPFFLWFAPMLPHKPWDAPAAYRERYAGVAKELGPAKLAYFANVSRFDDVVGELVGYLDEKGLRESTLIVYLSDNGYDPVGKRGGEGKSTMFELGFRTPLVFRWPGHVPAGVVREDLVSALDLYPTLLDYGGAAAPAGRLGIDLRPAIEKGTPVGRAEILGFMSAVRPHFDGERPESPPGGTDAYFLRDARWHYVWYPKVGDDQLFDLSSDPGERRNVIAEHPDRAEEFRKKLEAWWESLR